MSARADTDLLALQTRATSLTGRDCYDLPADECAALIREREPKPLVDAGVLYRLGLDEMFRQQFGGAR